MQLQPTRKQHHKTVLCYSTIHLVIYSDLQNKFLCIFSSNEKYVQVRMCKLGTRHNQVRIEKVKRENYSSKIGYPLKKKSFEYDSLEINKHFKFITTHHCTCCSIIANPNRPSGDTYSKVPESRCKNQLIRILQRCLQRGCQEKRNGPHSRTKVNIWLVWIASLRNCINSVYKIDISRYAKWS